MMTDFKKDLQQNTLVIANITKAVDFNAEGIKKCKEKKKKLEELNDLKKHNIHLENRMAELEIKTAEMERYKRRWNFRLNGLYEKKDENTRELTVDLLLMIAPHWKDKIDFILDSVHPIGNTTNCP